MISTRRKPTSITLNEQEVKQLTNLQTWLETENKSSTIRKLIRDAYQKIKNNRS